MAERLQIIAEVKAQSAKVTLSDLDQMIDKLRLKRIDVNFDKNNQATKNVKLFADELGNLYQVTEKLKKDGSIGSATVKVTEFFDKQAKAAKSSTAAVNDAAKATEEHGKKTKKAKPYVDEYSEGLEETSNKANLLSTALGRLGQIALANVTRAFRDALEEMKKVDAELIVVKKVTDASTEELELLQEKAYTTAQQYGTTASEYLTSVAEFSRAGYKEQAADLAELATKLQLVGDLSGDVANKFLIAVDKSYKFNGNVQKLSETIDKANEIDNNYATTIEKIASGMGIIAPVAAQLNVSLDETMAAVGTITAVTQRSGTEAARALRAIMLNIIGDTKTEIEDGATWTAGEIIGLRDLLKKYAPEIVEEANKMGTVINPMEAIGALAQAYKDGLLTAQELTEKVSDIGGKLRTPQLLALIQNWDDMYLQMMDDIETATGSANKEVENALTGWEAKLNILKTSWTDFVQKSISTDAIKGAIDALTWIIDSVGSLGNVLLVAIPILIAFKAEAIMTFGASMISMFANFGQNIAQLIVKIGNFINALRGAADAQEVWTARIQVGASLIAIAIAAIVIAMNRYQKNLEDTIQRGEKAATSLLQIQQLSEKYEKLNEEAADTKEAQDARQDLIDKLIDEGVWVDSVIGKYDTLDEKIKAATKEAIDYRRVEVNDALNAAESNINWLYRTNLSANYVSNAGNILGLGANYANPNGMYNIFNLDAERLLKLYDLALQKRAEFAQGIGGAPESKEDKELKIFIDTYRDAVEKYRDAKNALDSLNGTLEETGRLTTDASGINGKLTLSFVGLADEINNATSALEAYKKALELGEKGDTFKSYAEAYASALSMFENGLTGTNQYMAAIDLLIPSNVLASLKYNYEEAGKLLGSDFYKALFEYGGADYGANAAQYLKDNESLYSMFYDVFDEGDGNFKIAINDIKGLSDELKVSEETLWAMLDGWDAFNSATAVSISDIKLLKEQFTDENSGVLDFTQLISKLVDEGKTDSQIRNIVQGIMQMEDVDLSELPTNLTQAIQDIRDLKDEADAMGDGVKVLVRTDPEDVTTVLDPLKKEIETLSGTPVVIRVVYYSDDFVGPLPKYERGIKKADAGLAVVNEKGAELIKTGNRAYIANQGRLGLVKLNEGDTVYNANETSRLINQAVSSDDFLGGDNKSDGSTSSFSSSNLQALLDSLKNAKEDEEDNQKTKNRGGGGSGKSKDPDLLSMLSDYIKELLDKAKKALDAQIDTIDAQIEALKKEHDAQEEENELEELRLKILEAEKNLIDANVERTVRYFNKETGQWEWMADQKAVAEAQKALEDAQKNYYDKLAEIEYQAKLDELNERKQALKDSYNNLSDTWSEIKDEISKALNKQDVLGLAEILTRLGLTSAKGSVGEVTSLISDINAFTGSFDNGGFAFGKGFLRKGISQGETILDETITDRILSPKSNSQFTNFTNSLTKLFGMSSGEFGAKAQSLINSIDRSSNTTGDTYYINGVRIGSDMIDRPLSDILSVLPIYAG